MTGKKPTRQCAPLKLLLGDIVEIRWTDVWASDRMTWEDVNHLEELGQTKTYGVVVRHMDTCIVVAQEIGDKHGDGHSVTQLPYGLIQHVRLLGRTKVVE